MNNLIKVFNPLSADHPLVTDGIRCVLCGEKFLSGEVTTLLVPFRPKEGTSLALPVHASCVTLALAGVGAPPNEVALEDPELPPQQRELQQRYGRAIALTMVSEMDPGEPGACMAMVNALLANAVLGLRVLDKAGTIKPGGLDRVVQRIKMDLESS